MVSCSLLRDDSSLKVEGAVKSPLSFLMTKYLSYIAAFIVSAFILMPPLDISPIMGFNMAIWTGVVLIFAFLGFSLLRTSMNPFLKALSVYLFIISFLSACPHVSFNCYCVIVACLGLYLVFTKITRWEPIFKGIEGAFWVICVLLVMQSLNKDSLLSFGSKEGTLYGCAMNKMMMCSLLACMAPFLLIRNKFYSIPLLILFVLKQHDFFFLSRWNSEFIYGRPNVWFYTLKTYLQHPFVGWGMGTYKFIFPAISVNFANPSAGYLKDATKWLQAHNDYLQVLWEAGGIGLGLFMAYIISVFVKSRKDIYKIIGLVIMGLNMMIYFPMRMIQVIPLMILWGAYCEKGHYE